MNSGAQTPYHASNAFKFEMALAMIPTGLFGLTGPFMIQAIFEGVRQGEIIVPRDAWSAAGFAMYLGAAAGLWGFWRLALAYRAGGREALLIQPVRNWLMAHAGAVTAGIGATAWFSYDPSPYSEIESFRGGSIFFSFGVFAWVPYLTLISEYRRARMGRVGPP